MSKRAGEFITLDELLAEVGVDAARWFFASRGATDRASTSTSSSRKKQSAENPVYYVQYAHARIARSCARRPRPGWRRRLAGRHARRRRRGACWRGRRSGCPRSSRTRLRPRRPRASRPTRPSWRRRSTPTTAMRASSIRRTRNVGGAAGAGRRDADDARRTRSACWGSPRPSRCSARRLERRAIGCQLAERGLQALPDRVVRCEQHGRAPCRQDPGQRPVRASSTIGARRLAELRRVVRRVPGRLERDRPGTVRAVEQDDPVAAPARGRVASPSGCPGGRRWSSQVLSWNSPNVSSSPPTSRRPCSRRDRPAGRRRPAASRTRTSRDG